jgi:hypothetical protein
MNSELTLEDLRCGASDQNHFVIDPVKLDDCEHSICKKCIPKSYIDEFECKICGQVSEQDFSTCEVSEDFKKILNDRLEDIFKALEAETTSKLNEIQGVLSNKSVNLNDFFYYSL